MHMLIWCQYYVDTSKAKLRQNFRFFFSVISMGKNSTSFQSIFFNVISKGEKSTSFWRNFFELISIDKISTWFWCPFFNLILMDKKLMQFRCFFMQVWWMEKRRSFDVFILLRGRNAKNRDGFDVSFWPVFRISKLKSLGLLFLM